MLKPIRIAAATLAATAAIGMSPTGAGAQLVANGTATATVSATITGAAIGTRTVAAIDGLLMTSVLGTPTLQDTLSVQVAEAARTGTNGWYVTAALGSLSNITTNDPLDALAASDMAVSTRTASRALGGGTVTAPTGSEAMGSTRTLFTNTGQSESAVYTGTYSSGSTWTLTPPNGAKTGAYSGQITLTLFQ